MQPRNLVRPGQAVEVRVLSVDTERHRISLSMEASSEMEPGDLPEAARAPAKSFGTFGDLLKGGGKPKQ